MGDQKKFQGTPSAHAAVGLEPCLPLEPLALVIEPCHQGEREPHSDNGRRRSWRAADTALRRQCCLGLGSLLGLYGYHTALRWGHTVFLVREGSYFLLYHRNISCGIKYCTGAFLPYTLL